MRLPAAAGGLGQGYGGVRYEITREQWERRWPPHTRSAGSGP